MFSDSEMSRLKEMNSIKKDSTLTTFFLN